MGLIVGQKMRMNIGRYMGLRVGHAMSLNLGLQGGIKVARVGLNMG